jgi:hypothetical protein
MSLEKNLLSEANALCLVLHTTYPTLQRTFVVTYVILTPAPSSTAWPNPPRTIPHLIATASRTHLPLASYGRYLSLRTSRLRRAGLGADQPSPRAPPACG